MSCPSPRPSTTLDEIVAARVKLLTGYQNAELAERYKALVERVRKVEDQRGPAGTRLAEAVARNYAKLLAYKDEYEVARLYAEAAFAAGLNQQFEGDYKLKFHLAPPLFAQRDPQDRPSASSRSSAPGCCRPSRCWRSSSSCAARRSTSSATATERKTERALIGQYESLVDELLAGLTPANHALAVKLASMPDDIRGYGHVKDAHLAKAKRKEADLLAQWRNPEPLQRAAE